jgi:hypothetical protein
VILMHSLQATWPSNRACLLVGLVGNPGTPRLDGIHLAITPRLIEKRYMASCNVL